ncbi:transposase family protein [Streptomyces sp. NPDC015032]|uniref:transposase family protein n=1 Tax=Streptomyces sp. NPDC015032 TaxID=3364937 RepID=UPI0036FD25C5
MAATLLICLTQVPDPRHPRGVRHALECVLVLVAAAVLTGARRPRSASGPPMGLGRFWPPSTVYAIR